MYKIIIFFIIISLIRGEDYYEMLGLNKSAGQDEIRKAFKKLAIIYHPDKNTDDPNAHNKFIRLTTAYEILKDNDLRRKYDLYGENGLDNSNKKPTHNSWKYYQNNLIYEDDQYVIILETNDYFKSVINSDSSWFVNFYNPMCSRCHHIASTWKKIAKLLDGVVKIAVVNCEQDRQICYLEGIHNYPTLFHFKKNSRHGAQYMGEQTQEAIMRFALDELNIHVPEISESQLELFLRGENITPKSMLIFICSDQQNCFTSDEKLIVAAKFDKLMIDVKVFMCKDRNCHDKISSNTHAVYLSMYNASSWEPVFFDSISDINMLIEKVLEQLPNPRELTDNDFEIIRNSEFNVAWLICFYLGDQATSKDMDLQIKKLSISGVNLGKMNCGRNGQFCNILGVNRYPIWGMLKPGGAFELNHEKNTNNNIIKFVQISLKTANVWALSAKEALSILQRNNGNEVWFLDWYTPWCPPCIQFLSELRMASLEFDASVVRFGTIDCTIHTVLCKQYNIQRYPTAMLINGSNTYQFRAQKTAANVIQFIDEKRNPSELTSENFRRKLVKKKSKVMWIVDYFVSWCVSCQRLKPEWIAVAKSLNNLSFVNVASIDCEAEVSLCTSQGVRSYPNIRMYPLGSEGLNTVALYNGRRDLLSILTWITSFFPKKVRDLNPSDYQKVLNSKNIWIVDFYLPQCWPCQKMQSEFVITAQLLEKVKFGRINCNSYPRECGHIEIFPSLILYNSKQKRKHNYSGVRIAATTAEEIRNEILKIITSHMQHDEL